MNERIDDSSPAPCSLRYFVDERTGCIAVRDRGYTDPDYNGLHADTVGVVRYWGGKPETETCPTCGHTRSNGFSIADEDRQAAHELCDRLNAENTRLDGQEGSEAEYFVVLHRLVGRWQRWRREQRILRQCGCVAYCPRCREPLNDQASWFDPDNDGHGCYQCSACNRISEWHFGIAPGPVCLSPNAPLHLQGGAEPCKSESGCSLCPICGEPDCMGNECEPATENDNHV